MRALVLVMVAAAMLAARPAEAIGQYPPAIESHLFLDYEPPCSLCHLAGVTGEGTATTPFAMTMKSRGLKGESVSSLRDALDAVAAEGIDSDGDGMGDVDELIAGQDPNVPDGDFNPQPEYGCGMRIAGGPGGTGGLFGVLALLAIAALRRDVLRA